MSKNLKNNIVNDRFVFINVTDWDTMDVNSRLKLITNCIKIDKLDIIKNEDKLRKIITIIKKFHTKAYKYLSEPVLSFDVYNIVKHYGKFIIYNDKTKTNFIKNS